MDLTKQTKESLKQIIKDDKMGLVSGKNKAALIKIIEDFRAKDIVKKKKSLSSSSTADKVKIYHKEGAINIYVNPSTQPYNDAVNRSYATQSVPIVPQQQESTVEMSQRAINPIKKWDTVKPTAPIKKVIPEKISEKAQQNKDIVKKELSQIKPRKIDPAFKSRLEDLFR